MAGASYDGSPVSEGACAGVNRRIRTCIGCREQCRDVELLRIVVAGGAVEPDPRRRRPGRGAWLHPRQGCFAMACQRRAFGRALKVRSQLDVTSVERYLMVTLETDA